MAEATAALADKARADLAALGFPGQPWLTPPLASEIDEVVIVGAGQTGLMAAAALKRDGLARIRLLDAGAASEEGPWLTYARMAELRTPKTSFGIEFNIPSLSVRSWYGARYGEAAWDALVRVPREDWKAYLDWYAGVFGLAIENRVRVVDVSGDPKGVKLTVETPQGLATHRARACILATGFDGAGEWRVPDFIRDRLPPARYSHTNVPLDPSVLKDKRIGVLGHGASAFDNAIFALQNGAHSVDLCFRRDRLPRVNPHRALENAGLMAHFPDLADLTKWRIARFFRRNDQPPAIRSFETAMALPGFTLRPASPWLDVRDTPSGVRVKTPRGELEFDYLLLATGLVVDLNARPELRSLRDRVRLWGDSFAPPAGEADARLAQLPYLDSHYAFQQRDPADVWVRNVFAFNFSSVVSHGPHSTSISGHRHCLPRLVRGVERRLLLDNEAAILPALEAYRSEDLPVADDFEARLIAAEWAEAV